MYPVLVKFPRVDQILENTVETSATEVTGVRNE